MRETVYEGLKPVLDAQMSKMSPEQRVAMASLTEEAKKREAEKLKWENDIAQKEKLGSVPHETEVEMNPLLPEPQAEDVRQATPEELRDLKERNDIDHDRAVAEGIERAHKQGGPDGADFKAAVEAMVGNPGLTHSLRYTQETLAVEFKRVFKEEIMALRNAGQKEYAHDDSSPFANFERGAKDAGLDRKQVLWVYAMKHKDGIAAAIKGHTSQREDVRGRINDLIVYLLLLRGIYNEEAGNTGNFGLGKLEE